MNIFDRLSLVFKSKPKKVHIGTTDEEIDDAINYARDFFKRHPNHPKNPALRQLGNR